MALLNDQPEAMRELLEKAQVIAVVGMSDKSNRPSNSVAKFMARRGYRIYPVNPTLDEIDGEKVYHSLAEIPEPIDIVDVFRRPEHLEGVVDEAISANAKAVWAQLGIHDEASVQKANVAGLDIVTNRCIKVEFMQLGVQK